MPEPEQPLWWADLELYWCERCAILVEPRDGICPRCGAEIEDEAYNS